MKSQSCKRLFPRVVFIFVFPTRESSGTLAHVASDVVDAGAFVQARVRQALVNVGFAQFA